MFFLQSDAASGVTSAEVFERYPQLVESIGKDVGAFLPELVLCLGIIWVIFADLFGKRAGSRKIGYHALGVLAVAGLTLLLGGFPSAEDSRSLFHGMIVRDGFGVFMKLLITLGTAICVPMVMSHPQFDRRRMGEFYGLLLGAVLGMYLMASARNLLMFFMGIEFASYTSYLLTGYLKGDRKAAEGSVKYVIYGSVASGIMVYGLSILYGLTGSLDVGALAEALTVSKASDGLFLVTALLCFAGFAYKISAFPLHFWAPDVYEGAPMPFTAFLSVVSKAAGFAILIRFIMAFGAAGPDGQGLTLASGTLVHLDWPQILAVLAMFTMTLGNLAALWQTNFKRLLAYSSIAHAGYLLMGVAAVLPRVGEAGDPGWQPILFYLIVYLFMNLGAFYIAQIVSTRSGTEDLGGFTGLGRRAPILAVGLFLFMISLIGLPPTGGFTGKWQLLKVAWEGGLHTLVIVAVMNTVISVYYYARIIKMMFLDSSSEDGLTLGGAQKAAVVLMVVPVLWLGLFLDVTMNLIRGLSFAALG